MYVPIFHHDEVVGVAGGLVEIVKHSDHCFSGVVECAQQFQEFVLVGDIEEGGGLVEKHDRCLLGEQHGHPHSLALATGEFIDEASCKFGEIRGGERLRDGVFVGGAPLLYEALVGSAPARDEIVNPDAFWGDGGLWQQA